MPPTYSTFPEGAPQPSTDVARARVDGQDDMLGAVGGVLLQEADERFDRQEQELLAVIRPLVSEAQERVTTQGDTLDPIARAVKSEAAARVASQTATLVGLSADTGVGLSGIAGGGEAASSPVDQSDQGSSQGYPDAPTDHDRLIPPSARPTTDCPAGHEWMYLPTPFGGHRWECYPYYVPGRVVVRDPSTLRLYLWDTRYAIPHSLSPTAQVSPPQPGPQPQIPSPPIPPGAVDQPETGESETQDLGSGGPGVGIPPVYETPSPLLSGQTSVMPVPPGTAADQGPRPTTMVCPEPTIVVNVPPCPAQPEGSGQQGGTDCPADAEPPPDPGDGILVQKACRGTLTALGGPIAEGTMNPWAFFATDASEALRQQMRVLLGEAFAIVDDAETLADIEKHLPQIVRGE